MPVSRAAASDETGDGLAVVTAHVLPQVAMLAGSLAIACGAVLVLRRFAGAIEPPAAAAALATCAAGLLLVAIGDLPARAAGPARSWLPPLLTRLGLLMAVAAMSLPLRSAAPADAIPTGLALLVAIGVAARGAATRLAGRAFRRPAPMAGGPPVAPAAERALIATPPPAPAGGQSPLPDRLRTADAPTQPHGSLVQRFERLALPGGAECVHGRLSVVVPAGTRTGYAHVGFCPPLATAPTVEVTTDYDGVEAVVSAAEVLPWGVRVECRLDEPAEETIEIPVDILATTPT